MSLRRIDARTLGLDASHLPKNILSLLKVLRENGHESYIVGGGVRDFLLGKKRPVDFDVATAAHPEQVRKLFSRCRIIGRRFRLAHVRSGGQVVEVATFRKQLHGRNTSRVSRSEEGRIMRDNVYGTLEQDAYRRDFIANSIYYDPIDGAVVCHPQTMDDIEARRLTVIGDADTSYREDPVRMLRAVRLATRLDLTMDKATEVAIAPNAELLGNESPARLFEEFNKLFHAGAAVSAFNMLRALGLLKYLFPLTDKTLQESETDSMCEDFLYVVLSNTDQRVAANKAVVPAFILTAMLWFEIESLVTAAHAGGEPIARAIETAFAKVLGKQTAALSVPKYCEHMMRDICAMQWQFNASRAKILNRLIAHPKFRAGYDFLCLRSQANLADVDLCEWWTRYQEAGVSVRKSMLKERTRKQLYA